LGEAVSLLHPYPTQSSVFDFKVATKAVRSLSSEIDDTIAACGQSALALVFQSDIKYSAPA